MIINLNYMGELLNIFRQSDSAHIVIADLLSDSIETGCRNKPLSIDEMLIFHLQLMIDEKLISNKDHINRNLKDIGIIECAVKGNYILNDMPIRLTQKGHDFSCALSNKDVLIKLQTELKDAPFKTVFDGGQKLLTHFFNKKIDSWLE